MVVAFALTTFAFSPLAQEIKAGDLTIESPWAGPPEGADVGAGYLEIRNAGAAADRLTGGSPDFANVEVKLDCSLRTMRQDQWLVRL